MVLFSINYNKLKLILSGTVLNIICFVVLPNLIPLILDVLDIFLVNRTILILGYMIVLPILMRSYWYILALNYLILLVFDMIEIISTGFFIKFEDFVSMILFFGELKYSNSLFYIACIAGVIIIYIINVLIIIRFKTVMLHGSVILTWLTGLILFYFMLFSDPVDSIAQEANNKELIKLRNESVVHSAVNSTKFLFDPIVRKNYLLVVVESLGYFTKKEYEIGTDSRRNFKRESYITGKNRNSRYRNRTRACGK